MIWVKVGRQLYLQPAQSSWELCGSHYARFCIRHCGRVQAKDNVGRHIVEENDVRLPLRETRCRWKGELRNSDPKSLAASSTQFHVPIING